MKNVYVTSETVRQLLKDGHKVVSRIVGAWGTVTEVDDRGFINMNSYKRGHEKVAMLPLTEKAKIVAVHEGDSYTLWNEEIVSPDKKITSSDLDHYVRFEGDMSKVYNLPTAEELSQFSSEAFIDLFSFITRNEASCEFPVLMELNKFCMHVALELVKRLDKDTFQISNDFRSHRDSWLAALEHKRDSCLPSREDFDDKSFWQREINVFNRTFDHLLSQGFEEIELLKLAPKSPERG